VTIVPKNKAAALMRSTAAQLIMPSPFDAPIEFNASMRKTERVGCLSGCLILADESWRR
jgi:hypothetical protein